MTAATSVPPVASRRLGAAGASATLWVVSIAVIVVAGIGGLALGSYSIPLGVVVDALLAFDPTDGDHVIVWHSRIPRVTLGLLVGAALGVAGVLMQSITRNPLADPGILGVNAGASAGIVLAIAYLGVVDTLGYVWFAFAGAAVATIVVYLLGTARRSGATPVRMALAGAAVTMAIGALTSIVLVSNEPTFLRFRYWVVGTLQGRSFEVILAVLPFIILGLVVAMALVRVLDAMVLGEQTARGLGVNVGVARAASAVAIVLLAGAATAAAGPIAFVGLAAAHIVRAIVGPSHTLLLPGALVAGPALVLCADLLGRIAVAPGELQTGIAVAILGGPLFIALVRSRRLASL